MTDLPKILRDLQQPTEKVVIPPAVKRAFQEATSNLANIQQIIKEQQAAIERSIGAAGEYARKIEFYENMPNQAEDINSHDGHQ